MSSVAQALALALTLGSVTSVFACSCAPPAELSECAVGDQQAALLVEVQGREDFQCSQFDGSFIAEAKIEKVFRDNTGMGLKAGEVVSISSSLFGNLCGYDLAEDTSYIVFALATGVVQPEDSDSDEEPEEPATKTKTVVNESGAEPAEPEEKKKEKEAPASSGSGVTVTKTTSEPRTATATVSDGGATARGSGTLRGNGKGTITTRVSAAGSKKSATTTTRRLLSFRGFVFNSDDHADSDFWKQPKKGKDGKGGKDGDEEEPVEEPVVVRPGVCGDNGAPVGELSTSLCSGNVANPSQEQIHTLAKGCGH